MLDKLLHKKYFQEIRDRHFIDSPASGKDPIRSEWIHLGLVAVILSAGAAYLINNAPSRLERQNQYLAQSTAVLKASRQAGERETARLKAENQKQWDAYMQERMQKSIQNQTPTNTHYQKTNAPASKPYTNAPAPAKIPNRNSHPITPEFISAVIYTESNGRAAAISQKGARGLMQIMPRTWAEQTRKVYGKSLPFSYAHDPKINKEVGTNYLVDIHNYLSNSLPGYSRLSTNEQQKKIAAAYNGGQTRLVGKAGKIERMPRETRGYVKKVSRRLVNYNS